MRVPVIVGALLLFETRIHGAAHAVSPPPAERTPQAIAVQESSRSGMFDGTWTWNGTGFDARWTNGGESRLRLEAFDGTRIVVRREDTAGPSTGLIARYEGTISSDRITEGTVSWTFGGETYSGTWSGTITSWSAGAGRPPGHSGSVDRTPRSIVIQETSGHGTFAGTWTWNGTDFDARWSNGGKAKSRVEMSSGTRIVVTRIDTVGPSVGLTARYEGTVSGDRITDGTVRWTFGGETYNGTWSGTITSWSAEAGGPPRPLSFSRQEEALIESAAGKLATALAQWRTDAILDQLPARMRDEFGRRLAEEKSKYSGARLRIESIRPGEVSGSGQARVALLELFVEHQEPSLDFLSSWELEEHDGSWRIAKITDDPAASELATPWR